MTSKQQSSAPVGAEMRNMIQRSHQLFPRAPYLPASAVRHARRQWIRKTLAMRDAGTLAIGIRVHRISDADLSRALS